MRVTLHFVLIGILLSTAVAMAQTAGFEVEGRATTTGANREIFAIPGARLKLTSVTGTTFVPRETSADANGLFRFTETPTGCYLITGLSEGMEGQSEPFCLGPDVNPLPVLVNMRVLTVVESVVVSAGASTIAIDPTQTSSVGTIGEALIENAPKANRSFEDALPLIPGVLRGPAGEITASGTRSSQSGVRLNGADVTDPVTGESEINLPADVVGRVEVLSSPYDAEYGGFAGALSKVETKSADMAKLRFSLQNFNPRLRKRDGSIMGVESATPRFTVTGPIKKGKLAFLHSTEYQFVRAEQEDAKLDPLSRDVEREALSVFTQLDAALTDKNHTTANFLVFPEKLNYFGLDAFQPQSSTPDLRRRGFLTTVKNVHQFESGALLLSQAYIQDLASDVLPRGTNPYEIGLETTQGAFYYRQGRDSSRVQLSELYHFKPLEGRGRHLLKVGVSASRESSKTDLSLDPVTWLGTQGNPVRRVEYGQSGRLDASKNYYSVFVQDKWSAAPGLTLDMGLRMERDSIVSRNNVSYRTGFAYSMGRSAQTVLRGGVGLFYAPASLFLPTFLEWPNRTETLLGPQGQLESTHAYTHRIGESLKNPKSLSWSLQLDQKVTPDLFVRLGYQQRRTTQNYLVERVRDTLNGDALLLTNDGRDSYREWQTTVRYRVKQQSFINVSYVRSSAVGDLNDPGSLFGATPQALIQPNERAPLAFDAPNRMVAWADIALPFEVRAAPVVEVRQGFPYSLRDEIRDVVGARNRGGRFPTYQTLDLQVTKRIALKFRGKERRVRLGVRVFNLLNTFNPMDVQDNIDSPYFGTYYRGVKRRLRGVLELGN